jgi:predicted nucleic acid-binding protein
MPLVVSNSSPLIGLTQIGQLGLLHSLFAEIRVPPAVAREVARSVQLPGWIVVQTPRTLLPPLTSLGPGEREAISLALELGADWVILDERAGRRAAERAGLQVVGTLGILLRAKQQGHIARVRPLLDLLQANHFHASPSLLELTLRLAGEAP